MKKFLCLLFGFGILASCTKPQPLPVLPGEKDIEEEVPEPSTGGSGEEPPQKPSKEPREDLSWKEVSQFPTVRIVTDNGRSVTSKDNYVGATITIEDPENMYSAVALYEGKTQIRGRGNTTWDMPKKPYRLKLEEAAPVLGMKENRDWVLLANYCDKTLLRNIVAFEISRIVELPWTPRCRTVELYLNNKYQGSYVLCQHKEVAKEKVDINVEAGDLYLEIDTTQDEEVCFTSQEWLIPFMFKDPAQPTQEQITGFKDYVSRIEDELLRNPGGAWGDLIDMDSFIGNYIVQEITKNVDGNFRKSNFLTKTVDGKLVVYHVWDFDIALGNCDYIDTQHENGVTNGPEGWLIKVVGRKKKADGWYPRLFRDPVFVKALQEKWAACKPELDQVPQMIDHLVSLGRSSYENNFKTWRILGTYVWPNYKVFGTYDEEVNYLKEFYTARIAWLDTAIMAL